MINLPLNRLYAVAGMTVACNAIDYIVASNLSIDVPDDTPPEAITALGVLLRTPATVRTPTRFQVSVAGIDLQTATKQALFSVPSGRRAVIQAIVVRDASEDPSAATFGFGFDAGASNVAAPQTLGINTDFPAAFAVIGAVMGVGQPGQTFGLLATVPTVGSITVVVDVLGYFY